MNKEVFISYKSDEFDDANWVRSILEQNGISCWMAPSCIPGGSNYAEEIPKAIKGCKVFVLILSQKSQESKWVPKEIDQAINEGKIIMPFMIENCSLKDDFNFYLSNIQRYYAYENKVSAIRTMIAEICAVLGKPVPCAENEKQEKKQPEEALASITPEKDNTSVIHSQPTPPPVNENEQRKKGKTVKEKKPVNKKKIIIPLIAAVGAIIMAIIVIFIGAMTSSMAKVTIAGQEISADTKWLDMENASFSQEDVDVLMSMELHTVELNSCTLPDSMYEIFNNPEIYSITLVNCNINNDSLKLINFEGLSSLTHLNISENKDITSLESLKNIKSDLLSLNISGTSVTDLAPVTKFDCLSDLNISDMGLNDISAIKDITSLLTLDISKNNLTDLDAISNLIYLEHFYAAHNPLESFDGIGNCTVLATLDLSSTSVSDISFVQKSAATLKELYLNDNNLSDISTVKTLTVIEKLSVDNNNLSSVTLSDSGSSLKYFSAESNGLTDIGNLSLNKNLEYLDISDNSFTGNLDLSFIAYEENSYTSLVLDVSGNTALTSIELPNIRVKSADLRNTAITDFSLLSGAEILSLTVTYNSQSDYIPVADWLDGDITIINCPLDKRVALENLFGYKLTCSEEEQSSETA